MKVLIVDDEIGVLQSMRYALDRDFDVQTATCATEGLGQLRSNQFDILILDVSMPDCDGIEMLTRVRAEWPDLPVLMLSADDERQHAARSAGANAWLAKPPDLVELRVTIQSLTDSSRGEN